MRFDEMTPAQHRILASKGGMAPHSKKPMREYCNKGHKLEGDNVDIVQRSCYNKDKTKKYTYQTYRCHECMLLAGRKRKRIMREPLKVARLEALTTPTHCPNGHELTGDNLVIYPHRRRMASGQIMTSYDRVCKQCARERYRLKKYGRADEPDHRIFK